MFSAWCTCSASGRSPKLSSTRLAAHSFTFGTSSSGTPTRWKTTSAGSSNTRSPTRSARGFAAIRSIISTASSRISGSSSAIRRGVNAFLMKPRRRVWSGGWIPDRPLEECVMPASWNTRVTSGGRGL